MENYLNFAIYFLVTSVVILIATLIFDLITKYKIWSEIAKGNAAVALSTGGIIFGVAYIMHSAITSNPSILSTISWGGLGSAALLIVYLCFELITPRLKVSEEIEKGNIAVGILSLAYSLAFSFIIGACIS
jgi:putative membrane protein